MSLFTATELQGRNYNLADPRRVRFFGVTGERTNTRGVWRIERRPGEFEKIQRSDPSMLVAAYMALRATIEARAGARINMLVMSPHHATLFWLEGLLSPAWFEEVIGCDEYVDIRNVVLGSREITFRVRRKYPENARIVAADINGRTLPRVLA